MIKASLEEAIDQIDVKNTLEISKRRFAWVNLLKKTAVSNGCLF